MEMGAREPKSQRVCLSCCLFREREGVRERPGDREHGREIKGRVKLSLWRCFSFFQRDRGRERERERKRKGDFPSGVFPF